ncbi:alpha/beta hydrolase [Actinomadura kijaniata]|uniref:Triacylglycerol lipase n=1 Tax=Actinomadura namibiensis TaxID=182080 RepID=A0A7W3QKU0_ACTNM|nr:alpha/beta hydrolase [Actinomadura namibiensis]MBA8950800.1 triacylglycerol lipase [Actinomadura namibiensis]
MDTRHLLDPQIASLIDLVPTIELSAGNLPAVREARRRFQEEQPVPPPPDGLVVEERRVPGRPGDPDVRVLVTRPAGAGEALPALLWIHGGGYVLGSADWDQVAVVPLAAEIGCVVVSVDYRLAPETPHPGPVNDCHAALSWLHGNAAELGVDPARIAVAGVSAGGGLAATLAQKVRDEGRIPLVLQALFVPMLDDRTVTESDPHPYTGEFRWTRASNAFGWSSLLGHEPGRDGVAPYAVAARCEDLGGLPPAFVSVGALDLFLEEDVEYARRLTRAGVPVELHVHPGVPHGIFEGAEVSARMHREMLAAVRRAFAV